MNQLLRMLGFAFLAASSATALAGVVEVTYVNPSKFEDAGNTTFDEKDNLEALARYLQKLGGELLPENQTLRIEVLDVDLAGTVRDAPRSGARVRSVRGRADWPRINLRYALEEDGKPVRSGAEWVVDLNYARGTIQRYRESETLYYEKRMLESWFRMRFVEPAQAPAR
jgi:hypothetical protein